MNRALGLCGTCKKYGYAESCGHHLCDGCKECVGEDCLIYYGVEECDRYEDEDEDEDDDWDDDDLEVFQCYLCNKSFKHGTGGRTGKTPLCEECLEESY